MANNDPPSPEVVIEGEEGLNLEAIQKQMQDHVITRNNLRFYQQEIERGEQKEIRYADLAAQSNSHTVGDYANDLGCLRVLLEKHPNWVGTVTVSSRDRRVNVAKLRRSVDKIVEKFPLARVEVIED